MTDRGSVERRGPEGGLARAGHDAEASTAFARTLAASAVHGINGSLSGAMAGIGLARHVLRTIANALEGGGAPDPGALAEGVELALDALGQARERVDAAALVTRGVGALVELDGRAAGPGDLSRALDAALAVAHAMASQRAEVVRGVEPGLHVAASGAQVGTLALGAVTAAVSALPDGGDGARLVVRARAEGDAVLLELEGPRAGARDDAHDAATATYAALAASLGGRYEVTARGATTRVTLSLPGAGRVADVRRGERARAEGNGAGVRRRGRVLVVDDDPVLLSLMARILEVDHDVVTARRAADALARVEAGDAFDVIVCDMMMPAMTGDELHRHIVERAPALARRMVFLTAGAFTESARAFLARGECPWFEKPMDPDDLRAVVRAWVDGDASPTPSRGRGGTP